MPGRGATFLSSLAHLDASNTRVILRGKESRDFDIGNDLDFGPLRDTVAHVPLQQRATEADDLTQTNLVRIADNQTSFELVCVEFVAPDRNIPPFRGPSYNIFN
jgi:hypothetical protein